MAVSINTVSIDYDSFIFWRSMGGSDVIRNAIFIKQLETYIKYAISIVVILLALFGGRKKGGSDK